MTMLDLKALEKALSIIGNVGKGELTFAVDGTPVTMRVLTADEDILVQRYAREGIDESGQVEDTEALTLLERFKRATLSHAIVQVGDIDLRSVEHIATGEVTDKGVQVRILKPLAVRKIIDGWARTATLALFQKYLELVRRVDAEADKAVQFNPQDLDAEIARVERRLDELKKEKEKSEALKRSGGTVGIVAEADRHAQERLRHVAASAAGVSSEPTPPTNPALPEAEEPPPTPTTNAAAPSPSPAPPARQRVMPTVAAPPSPPAPTPPAPRHANTVQPPAPDDFGSVMDSLSDSPEALAAETARLVAARAQARRASMEATRQAGVETNQLDAAHVIAAPMGRRPPHRTAVNTSDAAFDADVGSLEAVRVSGPVSGVETYRLGATPVLDRSRGAAVKPKKLAVDEGPKAGPTNPRFRSSGR